MLKELMDNNEAHFADAGESSILAQRQLAAGQVTLGMLRSSRCQKQHAACWSSLHLVCTSCSAPV